MLLNNARPDCGHQSFTSLNTGLGLPKLAKRIWLLSYSVEYLAQWDSTAVRIKVAALPGLVSGQASVGIVLHRREETHTMGSALSE